MPHSSRINLVAWRRRGWPAASIAKKAGSAETCCENGGALGVPTLVRRVKSIRTYGGSNFGG